MKGKFNSERPMGFAYTSRQEAMEFHLGPEDERIFCLSLSALRLLLNIKRNSEVESSISCLTPRGNRSTFI